MSLDFDDLAALERVADALEHQNALKRVELYMEMEARADYASDPATVRRNIRQMETEQLRDDDLDVEETVYR